ncbi:hypothetical protein Gpo141_00007628 [Globisporangium polare]
MKNMMLLRTAAKPSTTRHLRQWRQRRGLHAQSLVVPHRFALWQLRPNDRTDGDVGALLQQDRELLAGLPAPPVARMLLPANVAGPSTAHPFLYVPAAHAHSSVERVLAGNAPSSGFFALSLLPHQPKQIRVQKQELKTVPQTPGTIATQLLLSNALVNVWNFCVEPQCTCELHEHLLPYVFINRSSGSTRNLDAQMQDQGETHFRASEFRYVDVDPSQQRCIHAFRNTGEQALQQYVIEFKS